MENGFALGSWVRKQRKSKNRLVEDQLDKLEGIGFDWNYTSVAWENGFSQLKAYKDRVGDCRVPNRHLESNYKLGRWVAAQRKEKNGLSEDQIKRLDELEFDWDVVSTNWEKGFRHLEIYIDRVGHCRIPIRLAEDGFKLGRWVEKQRREKDKLSEEQRKRLEELGMEWDPRRLSMENRHGHMKSRARDRRNGA
jgi:hypothetical protein